MSLCMYGGCRHAPLTHSLTRPLHTKKRVRARPLTPPSITSIPSDARVPGIVQARPEVLAAPGAPRRAPPHRRPRLVRAFMVWMHVDE